MFLPIINKSSPNKTVLGSIKTPGPDTKANGKIRK
jgi:hypothetical protein